MEEMSEMKFKSRLLGICLVVVLMFCMGTATYADSELKSGDFGYVLVENEAKIVAYYGSEVDLQIPSELDGYKVTYIGENSFKGNEVIKSVALPGTIYKIENSAFEGCSNLGNVIFGDNTKWIANRAFADCPMISEIQLPANVKILGSEAFTGTGIKSITIPNSLVETHYDYISGNGPFGDSGLNSVVFEAGIDRISRGMFAGAEGLATIDIPDTVTLIDCYAFAGAGVNEVVVPDSVLEMGTHVFKDCSQLKSVKLSENAENIGAWMFANSGIESLVVPKSVREIGAHAFENCSSLKSVLMSNWVMALGKNAFENCTSLEEVVLSNNLVFINEETFLNCTALKELVIPFRVAYVNDRAFKGCTALEEVTMSRGLGNIGEDMFDWNTDAKINTASSHMLHYGQMHNLNCTNEKVAAESFEIDSAVPERVKLCETYQFILNISPINFTEGVSITSSAEDILGVGKNGKVIANETISGDVDVTIRVGSLEKVVTIHVGYEVGDADMDYAINAKDALAVLKHSAGIEELKSAKLKFADVNGDEEINAEDALEILKIAAGIN